MMLKVLLYAYCVGVPSSRKIAQEVIDDVAFRWLAAGSRPDFRTIAGFRRQHLADLKPVFLQVLLLCKQAGLVKVGVVALDGTKVVASASLDRNRTWEKLSAQEKDLLGQVEAMLERAESTDRDEDDRFGDDSGSGLPKVSSARERLALIRRDKSELEAQARARAQEKEERRKEREAGAAGRWRSAPGGESRTMRGESAVEGPGTARAGRSSPLSCITPSTTPPVPGAINGHRGK